MIPAHEILNASILIVDDQVANVQLLERLLGDAGYVNVASTMQSPQVGPLHRQHRYDLILLDLEMPDMDGFEVMKALATNAADSYLPVIVLTAQPAHKVRALQAGAKDFISKPFDLVEVKTRIHNMLEVRLLNRKLDDHNRVLEQTVADRTAELRESEARFRRLTALASDWYWEQNETGSLTHVSGPVVEMLGLGFSGFLGETASDLAKGWVEEEHALLRATIAARQPFLDFALSRVDPDGSERHFRVSGEAIFSQSGRYTGYRGIGVEVGRKK